MKTLTLLMTVLATSVHAQNLPSAFDRQKQYTQDLSKFERVNDKVRSQNFGTKDRLGGLPDIADEKNSARTPKKIDRMLRGGSEGTGGGDVCEDRIKIIRDDLKSWIQKGGAKFLRLPEGIGGQLYSKKMIEVIAKTKIKCVAPGDDEYPVQVNGTPKTCKFQKNPLSIVCDMNKFQSLDESDQYVLVHHEFAGLADIEVPNEDDSNYETSNQITSYLVETTVKRLAVKTVSPLSLKIGTLVPANPGETYVLGQKIYLTQQSYGLTINGDVAYGGFNHSWYAVVNTTKAEGSNVYLAKGKLQVVYGRGVNGGGILCEYPIQVKLTEMGLNNYLAAYQFPLAIATSIALPGGSCPVVNSNTLWSGGNSYNLIQ